MKYIKRVTHSLKLLFSKKGYDITFNKRHPEYKNGITFNENQSGYVNTFVLLAGYVTISLFIILSIALGYCLGLEGMQYIPILGIVPVILILLVNSVKFSEITKKYGDDKGTSTLLELNLLFVPPIIMIGIVLGLTENNILSGIGFIIATSYPWLLMLCRISVFSDKSIPRYEGTKMSIELGPGYVHIIYWLLSVQIGFAVTKVGFKNLQISLASGDPSMIFCIVSIVLGLICQSIVVFPDKIDRVVPVDMKMKKGYILLVIITIILVFTSWAIMNVFKA